MSGPVTGFNILKECKVGTTVVCLLKIGGTFFVRVVTGVEGVVETVYKTGVLEEAENFLNDYIKKI